MSHEQDRLPKSVSSRREFLKTAAGAAAGAAFASGLLAAGDESPPPLKPAV